MRTLPWRQKLNEDFALAQKKKFLLSFLVFWYLFASAAPQRPTCSYHANPAGVNEWRLWVTWRKKMNEDFTLAPKRRLSTLPCRQFSVMTRLGWTGRRGGGAAGAAPPPPAPAHDRAGPPAPPKTGSNIADPPNHFMWIRIQQLCSKLTRVKKQIMRMIYANSYPEKEKKIKINKF